MVWAVVARGSLVDKRKEAHLDDNAIYLSPELHST